MPMSDIASEIISQKETSYSSLKTKRELWDSMEKLFHGQLNDSISSNTKSQVFDPRLSTLVLERGYRVMAQLPTGKVKAISKNDNATSKLMNLILDKYVTPNANAQFDFLTKLRMMDIYSNVYGNFFGLVDWDVKKNGYVGPDLWLLNIRDVFPQIGSVSLEDSDQIIVRTWRPLSYFEDLKKGDGFKNLDQIVTKLKEKAGSKQNRDSDSTGKREESQFPTYEAAKKLGYFEVLTRFEKDRWVDVCVDADEVFRDIKNPHDNEELPVVCKYAIPLLDDFFGVGDLERGAPMQMTMNSVWNYYLDAVKMSIFPPVLLNKDNIASMSSIKMAAAEKWLVRGQINNAAQTLSLSPQGISTFNNTYQVANASILNLFGTTDTTVSEQVDAGLGKTPKALQLQQQRENTRDNADRFYMEQFLKNTMKKMVNLISKKQSSAVSIRMFGDEIDQIARDFPEIKEFYDENKGKLNINKSKTGSVLYDYEIVSGSTYALDQKTQQDNLQSLLDLYLKSQTPQGNLLVNNLDQEGFILKFGELFKRTLSSSGIQDWDKILVEKTEQEKSETILNNDAMAFQQALQQTMGGGNSMNQIPPTPGGSL